MKTLLLITFALGLNAQDVKVIDLKPEETAQLQTLAAKRDALRKQWDDAEAALSKGETEIAKRYKVDAIHGSWGLTCGATNWATLTGAAITAGTIAPSAWTINSNFDQGYKHLLTKP